MAGCIGFEESLVLSLKDSWTKTDLRQLLIEKDPLDAVRYHSRECKGPRDKGNRVSSLCDIWFHNISAKNNHSKTKEQFFKEESEMLQDRTENSHPEGQSEESSCEKAFDAETNGDELNEVVDKYDEEPKTWDELNEIGYKDGEEPKIWDESQLGVSKHQAARFVLNQRKSKKNQKNKMNHTSPKKNLKHTYSQTQSEVNSTVNTMTLQV